MRRRLFWTISYTSSIRLIAEMCRCISLSLLSLDTCYIPYRQGQSQTFKEEKFESDWIADEVGLWYSDEYNDGMSQIEPLAGKQCYFNIIDLI